MGSGDRSERIRTYNFPQGRMTDHRIGLTLYRLDAIMAGDIGEIVDSLRAYYQMEALKQQALERMPLFRQLGVRVAISLCERGLCHASAQMTSSALRHLHLTQNRHP